jgi:hypothetical protein
MTIRYFIPDWDDRVDPNYNFLTDEHTPGRNPYKDDYYAHEIYPTPPYDGILLSLATLDANKSKRAGIREAGSVHRYLRLPADGAHEVLGDCGAFTYWREETPPYQTKDVLEAYEDLGFDLGVSVDHLIFTELAAEKQRRWQLTLDNARDFLRLYRNGTYHFQPVGVAQGWNAESYQQAAQALVDMGYERLAIGGLVRTRTQDVLKILTAIKEVLPAHTQVHLFGVSRPEYAHEFTRLGVTSFDSASRLRRAWMDGRRNYFLGDDAFAAIRIPEAQSLAKKLGADEAETRRHEQAALETLRAYNQDQATLTATLDAAIAYATLAGADADQLRTEYTWTLQSKPWQQCPCEICRAVGVEVIIFRGNNRNRRRGFHNTWQLYRQLQDSTTPNVKLTADNYSRQLEFSL